MTWEQFVYGGLSFTSWVIGSVLILWSALHITKSIFK